MQTRLARRAFDDAAAVCRSADPASAARWLAALAVSLPDCITDRSLVPADRGWNRSGAAFRVPGGSMVWLPARYTAGAREMYCRNVYLRTGLTMPAEGWVVDLGANRGLFSVWAALAGAQVVAVEAQQGFAAEIRHLADHNIVGHRVHVETGLAGGTRRSGGTVGVLAEERRWAATSHGTGERPPDVGVPQLMARYQIGRIGLLKVDIEGGEFAVFCGGEDLRWLDRVGQIALEIHHDFGDAAALVRRLRRHGFTVDLRDNDGQVVAATSPRLDYAYCHRP